MKQNTNERIEAVVNYSGMSMNHFAKHIGLLRGENLYQIRKGNNGISLDVAERIGNKFPEINKLWLITGDGEMLNPSERSCVPWSDIASPTTQAFRAWATTLALQGLLAGNQHFATASSAVHHADELVAELAKSR